MASKSDPLGSWREYFRSANSNIFDVIESGIMVAAADCPKELRLRRGRIAEMLFSSRLTRCVGCNRVEVAVPYQQEEADNEEGNGFKESPEFNEGSLEKESKNDVRETDRMVSHYSYDEAEALTEEIEEENQKVAEVLRIKGILNNHKEESEGTLFDALRRLQLMGITVGTLQGTEIGKAVNCVRKYGSKRIQLLARTLIEGWKKMVDEWVNAGSATTESSPDSVNPSGVDEEGLPSPPLDEGAFLATQTTSIELSQFFDGMDDDGNPSKSGRNVRKQKPLQETNLAEEEKNQIIKQEAFNRQIKPDYNSGPGRPAKLNTEHKAIGDVKPPQRKDVVEVQKKPPTTSLQDKSKCSTEILDTKFEATKRMFHERYQEHENAKKQRTIQVMELHDLPKQGLGNRNIRLKPGFNNRNRTNLRR